MHGPTVGSYGLVVSYERGTQVKSGYVWKVEEFGRSADEFGRGMDGFERVFVNAFQNVHSGRVRRHMPVGLRIADIRASFLKM